MGVDLDDSVKAFLDSVSSSSPTPGGGSVAALAGALASALAAMVCRLTLGKEGGGRKEVDGVLQSVESLRQLLQDLTIKDSQAYGSVVRAFRMDKATESAKAARTRAIQEALQEAAEVPLETGERCLELLNHLRVLAEWGSPAALSDVGVAAALALAALRGARYNVLTNLASLKDERYVAETRSRLESMEGEAEAALQEVTGSLRKRANLA